MGGPRVDVTIRNPTGSLRGGSPPSGQSGMSRLPAMSLKGIPDLGAGDGR